jgi:hypothetical protein
MSDDYPCEECDLKEADLEDVLDRVQILEEILKISEKALCRALSAKEKRIYLPVSKALAKIQKLRENKEF